jgi:hypothetical protein
MEMSGGKFQGLAPNWLSISVPRHDKVHTCFVTFCVICSCGDLL